MSSQPNSLVRGSILNPLARGSVAFIEDGVLAANEHGILDFVGTYEQFRVQRPNVEVSAANGIICPPFFDAHIHIPQHPIRGHFLDGVEDAPQAGRLIAGLNRNVFPAEGRFADGRYAEQIIRQFLEDTLAHGVIGGAAYSTAHRPATERALELLPESWSLGLVLMTRNCPEYLRNDEANLDSDLTHLAERFGKRMILTDRFAVTLDSHLRRRALKIAEKFDLTAQTHLNEQLQEKLLVEQELYPDAGSYTNVYARDGLLDRFAILAHCVHMRDEEFQLLRKHNSAVAHCPTSNTLLGSGIIPLDRMLAHEIDYAICTDVGASPTTSLLAEMAQFLKVHAGRSRAATPSEALYRVTLAPARMLGVDHRLGSFEVGKDLSFVELQATATSTNVDRVIHHDILEMQHEASLSEQFDRLQTSTIDTGDLDTLTRDAQETAKRLDNKVVRVVLKGKTAWQRR